LPIFSGHSIIRSVRILGALSALLIIVVAIFSAYFAITYDKQAAVKQSIMLYERLLNNSVCDESIKRYLKMSNLTRIDEAQANAIFKMAKPLIQDDSIRKTIRSGNIQIFVHDGHYYYGYMANNAMYYFRNNAPMTPYWLYASIITAFMFLGLFWLYRYITRAIIPLQEIKTKMDLFAQGNHDVRIEIEGNDEVARVAKAFNVATAAVTRLQKSRILFLRNIMHELKTPITQGKLIAHMMDDTATDKVKLMATFERLEVQLRDLADVEAITSKSTTLERKRYALIDIFENACDILELDATDVTHNIADQWVNVDFNLFTIVIKNLLDNAKKYATKLPITLSITDNRIVIMNEAKALTQDISQFLEPFSRDDMHINSEGFGLGLYITKAIIEQHGASLHYHYANGAHHFSIENILL